MSAFQNYAARLSTSLGLARPPVALAFMQEPPVGVATTTRISPASCGFWPQAESAVFYAQAEQHHHCQIGAMVMGFELPEQIQNDVGKLVEAMCGCSYIGSEEGSAIPSVPGKAAGILYGPLAQFPTVPDAVLLWLTPAQAMIYQEAAGSASWAAPPTRTSGRPACAVIPLSMSDGRAVLSMGCKGMRTFTEVDDIYMLAAVPGRKLAEFLDSLQVTVAANQEMASYYDKRKSEVAALASAAQRSAN